MTDITKEASDNAKKAPENDASSCPYLVFFVQRIREITKEKDMSYDLLCKKAGISRSYLPRLFQFQSIPSLQVCSQIADALETPLSVMLDLPEKAQLGVPAGQKRIHELVPEDFSVSAAQDIQKKHNAETAEKAEDSYKEREQQNTQTLILMKILESQSYEEKQIHEIKKLLFRKFS